MKKIYTVTVDGVQHQYPEGTPYQDIAGEVQSAYSNDILWWNETEDCANWGNSWIGIVR